MQYIVNLSSGLASTEAGERTIAKVGREHTTFLFADVKGHSTNEHAGEDADNYRFLADTEHYFGIPIIRIVEGRDIWQVMFDERAIVIAVGKQNITPCSMRLKRDPIDAWIAGHYAPDQCVLVSGLGWSEVHRIANFEATKAPYACWFPMNEAPYMDNCHIAAKWDARGIKAPALYEHGFSHANCGGFCVRGGQAHFARLYFTNKPRYLYHAAKESQFQAEIRKEATILRRTEHGVMIRMSLYEFAERLDCGEEYDKDDWGGCGCFSQTPQLRMDDLLLETSVR